MYADMPHFHLSHWREKIVFSFPSMGCKQNWIRNIKYLIPWKVMNKSLANKNFNVKKW